MEKIIKAAITVQAKSNKRRISVILNKYYINNYVVNSRNELNNKKESVNGVSI